MSDSDGGNGPSGTPGGVPNNVVEFPRVGFRPSIDAPPNAPSEPADPPAAEGSEPAGRVWPTPRGRGRLMRPPAVLPTPLSTPARPADAPVGEATEPAGHPETADAPGRDLAAMSMVSVAGVSVAALRGTHHLAGWLQAKHSERREAKTDKTNAKNGEQGAKSKRKALASLASKFERGTGTGVGGGGSVRRSSGAGSGASSPRSGVPGSGSGFAGRGTAGASGAGGKSPRKRGGSSGAGSKSAGSSRSGSGRTPNSRSGGGGQASAPKAAGGGGGRSGPGPGKSGGTGGSSGGRGSGPRAALGGLARGAKALKSSSGKAASGKDAANGGAGKSDSAGPGNRGGGRRRGRARPKPPSRKTRVAGAATRRRDRSDADRAGTEGRKGAEGSKRRVSPRSSAPGSGARSRDGSDERGRNAPKGSPRARKAADARRERAARRHRGRTGGLAPESRYRRRLGVPEGEGASNPPKGSRRWRCARGRTWLRTRPIPTVWKAARTARMADRDGAPRGLSRWARIKARGRALRARPPVVIVVVAGDAEDTTTGNARKSTPNTARNRVFDRSTKYEAAQAHTPKYTISGNTSPRTTPPPPPRVDPGLVPPRTQRPPRRQPVKAKTTEPPKPSRVEQPPGTPVPEYSYERRENLQRDTLRNGAEQSKSPTQSAPTGSTSIDPTAPESAVAGGFPVRARRVRPVVPPLLRLRHYYDYRLEREPDPTPPPPPRPVRAAITAGPVTKGTRMPAPAHRRAALAPAGADTDLTIYDLIDADRDTASEILDRVDEARKVAAWAAALQDRLDQLKANVAQLKIPGSLSGNVVRLLEQAESLKSAADDLVAALPRASEAIATAAANASARHRNPADRARDLGHRAPAEAVYHKG
ncbi:hypothetical protein [Embleya hyalina]|uniref:Uncharacterized protein n=1 Tax=Embleya hyalina TaxID=516124 RepID=A0A401YYS2_9ACTN|nr:hypothetical protein [Embleya hyalina]GCD99738.1 hypothetical protein EHYA_07460 [Embleya hyalina]